jgi:hypothetical protein
MSMPIVDRGTAFSGGAGGDHQCATAPIIVVMPDGRWLCSLRTTKKKSDGDGHLSLTWSDDEGRSWSEPARPLITPEIEGCRGDFRGLKMTLLEDGSLLAAIKWVDRSEPKRKLFSASDSGVQGGRFFLSRSFDGGESWSKPGQLPPFEFDESVTGPTAPLLRLANGDLAFPIELSKPQGDDSPSRHFAAFMYSPDEGRSWPEHAIVAHDPTRRIFYWDHRPVVLSNGNVLELFWTFDTQEGVYLNMHASRSGDHGRTWSPIWDTGLPGQAGPPLCLRDNRIALVYVDRTGAPAIKIRVSGDDGASWPQSSELTLYRSEAPPSTSAGRELKEAWSEMYEFAVGLPTLAETATGDIIAVYYAGPEADQTGIEWVRIGL